MKKTSWLVPLGVWLLLRLVSSSIALLFSALRPLEGLERQIAAWPPAPPFSAWFYRAVFSPWLRWDTVFFAQITRLGYAEGPGSASFHPLYTLLARWLWQTGADPLAALWLIGSLAALGFFVLFYAYEKRIRPPEQAGVSLLLLALFPASFILFAPYTESLFLLLAAGCLYALERKSPLLAGSLAFLAALTRQQGVFLFLPAAWLAWQAGKKVPQGLRLAWRWWLGSLGGPLGLLAWSGYRLLLLRETPLRLDSWQGFIYSAILSPSAQEIIPNQQLMLPWQAVWLSLRQVWLFPNFSGVFNLLGGGLFIVLLLAAWKHLSGAEKLYSLGLTLVSLSMVTGLESSYVYLSLPRHLALAFPVFGGLALSLRRRWQSALTLGLFGLLWVFSLMLFVLHAWIP